MKHKVGYHLLGTRTCHLKFGFDWGVVWFVIWRHDLSWNKVSVEKQNKKLYCNRNRHRAWSHDDVIKWKIFLCYWPFVRGIHRSPVNSLHKGQRRGALMFSLICAWINGWANNREAGDLRRRRAHHDVIVMSWSTYTRVPICTYIRISSFHFVGHI